MVETSGFRLFPRSESIACIMFTGILHIWCMINALEAPGIAISLLSHSHYYNLMYFGVEIGMISDCLQRFFGRAGVHRVGWEWFE